MSEIAGIKDAAGAYRRWALEARKQYIDLRLRQDPEIRGLYIRSADKVARELRKLALKTPSSYVRKRQLEELEAALRAEADRLAGNLEKALGKHIEQAVDAGGGYSQAVILDLFKKAGIDTAGLRSMFATVNRQAVEACWARTKKGLFLSDRVWEQSEKYRNTIRDIIQEAVATGQDAVKTARMLQQYVRQGKQTLARDYPKMMERMGNRIPGDICYEALRLARTEMTAAFGEGAIAAAQASPSYQGMKWVLSHSHPMTDVCDALAAHDEGLGWGVYAPGNEPPYPAHPNCLCVLIPVHANPEKFVERLKKWRDDPTSDQALEKWYNYKHKIKQAEVSKHKPTVFKAAKTKKEAEEFAREVLKVNADYSKYHIDIANAVNSEIFKAKQVFGDVGGLKSIGTFPPGYSTRWKGAYSPSRKAIWLRNVGTKNSLTKLKQVAENSYQVGFWSTGSEVHTIRHEFGHAIEHSLRTSVDISEYNRRMKQINDLRVKIQKEVFDSKAGTKEYKKYLSKYGFTNTGEFIAESVAEYLEGNPRETAKTVVAILLGIL